MSSFEIGATRPVGAIHGKATLPLAGCAASTAASTTPAAGPVDAAAQVETSDAVKAGDAPVDSTRVATIRKAIEKGTYPVIPMRVADAMIAAGMLLRNHQ